MRLAGMSNHVLNRAVGRFKLFPKATDFDAFVRVLSEAHARLPIRLLAYCILSNHWHLVLWPKKDRDPSHFMRWLTVTHAQRWHACRHTQGTGPLYQGRFKSFAIAEDDHLFTVLRYVERNPVRAGLVSRGAKWRWSSLGQRAFGLEGRPLAEDGSRDPRIGLNMWIARKRSANWRICAAVPRATRRSEVSTGRKERPNDLVSSRAWRTWSAHEG
jgi:REP element-mobilizing transposase RayT